MAREVPAWPDVSEAERFPLAADAKPLDAAPPVPAEDIAPVVFLAPSFIDSRTSDAEAFERVYRFALQASSRERQALNLVPWPAMEEPYRREGMPWSLRNRAAHEYLNDALAVESDFLILNKASRDGEAVTVELSMMNLRTSQTQDWMTSRPVAEVRELIRESVVQTALFCGLSDEEIAQAGLDRNLPGPSAWQMYLNPSPVPPEVWEAAIEADPDAAILYDSLVYNGGHRALSYANRALTKWPDDGRLILSKVKKLGGPKTGAAALLLHSELLRRYPLSLIALHPLDRTLEACYPQQTGAARPPPPYLAAQQALWNACLKYQKNWSLYEKHSHVSHNLGAYVRGTQTAEKIPREIWTLYQLYDGQGGRSIDRAARLRPDSPELLGAAVTVHCTGNEKGQDWYDEILPRIRALDPSNVAAELDVAYSLTAGWSDPDEYLPFIREVIGRHAGDKRAMQLIADSLAQHLGRLVGFEVLPAAKAYGSNPDCDLFVQIAEDLLKEGDGLRDRAAKKLSEIYTTRGQPQKAEAVTAALTKVSEELTKHMDGKQYDQAVALARDKLARASGSSVRHWIRYVIVKSLWKMGRHEESLNESLEALTEFPDRATFHYMFAVVAVEKDLRLSEALHHAETAMPLDPGNAGLRKTLEKLRAKANTPPTGK